MHCIFLVLKEVDYLSKILLLGEYSGLHKNLKEGLLELGHEVIIASDGDHQIRINSDVDLSLQSKNRITKLFELKKKLTCFKGFDVVQFINPYISHKVGAFFYDSMFKNNKKVFCLCAGDDVEVIKFLLSEMNHKYTPYDELLMNNRVRKLDYTSMLDVYLHNKFMNKVSGIIPVMWEYAESYRKSKFLNKLNTTITFPINTNKIKYKNNKLRNKLVFYHASRRKKYKGSDVISEAMESFQCKYPNEVEMINAEFLPLNEYLDVISRTNVVVDQCRSHSYGMNAVYSLAMGKIVMSGSEPEALSELGITECPIFNITPNVNQIINQFEKILENRHRIEEMGMDSRTYVEKTHNYIDIAQKYSESWGI